jgi:hypothetical protein
MVGEKALESVNFIAAGSGPDPVEPKTCGSWSKKLGWKGKKHLGILANNQTMQRLEPELVKKRENYQINVDLTEDGETIRKGQASL